MAISIRFVCAQTRTGITLEAFKDGELELAGRYKYASIEALKEGLTRATLPHAIATFELSNIAYGVTADQMEKLSLH